MLSLGEARCALPAKEVVRVFPRVDLQPIAGVPDYVAGMLSYNGSSVPVLDLCSLVYQRPCRPFYSTRIVLVDYPLHPGEVVPLGLAAERVTDARRVPASEFKPCSLSQAGFLAGVAADEEGTIQALRVSELLTPDLKGQLFKESGLP